MDVYLDGQRCELEGVFPSTVRDVLDEVLPRVRQQGLVVVSIRCDGDEVESEDLERILSEPANRYARLDFVSGTAEELVIDALAHVEAMLMELEPTRSQVLESLQRGHTVEAMQPLQIYLNAWRRANEAVQQSAELLGLDLTILFVEDVPLAEVFARFSEQLRQLKEAFEAKDMVTLADILTYEAEGITRQWLAIIEQVKRACLQR